MLRAILNKSRRQHPTKHQLYCNLPTPPIMKIVQARRTRHAGHCWRSRDELKSDVLLWTPTCGRAKARRPARTYIEQLCGDTGCTPEDLSEAMNDREKWRERVMDIRAGSMTWWWWFVIAMMILCHIFRKCTGGYKLYKSRRKNQLLIIHGHQIVWQKRKRTDNLNRGNVDILWRHRNGVWRRKMYDTHNEKQKTSNDGRNRTIKSNKNRVI